MKHTKKSLLILTLLSIGLAGNAHAYCTGFGNMRTCNDNAGNSYTTSTFGNMSTTQGRNSRTGSNWNATTNNFGNMSITNGRASNGASWNSTTTNFGGMSTTRGRDSNGNSFSRTCNQFRCY